MAVVVSSLILHRFPLTIDSELAFTAFHRQFQKKSYIPMSGQIFDASLVPAPKQRNTEGEKQAVKEGKSAREIRPDEPAKAAQKDVDARWTLKIGSKVRYRPDGTFATDDRDAGLRLKVAHHHRPALRLHPGERGHLCIACRRPDAAEAGDDGQHVIRGLG